MGMHGQLEGCQLNVKDFLYVDDGMLSFVVIVIVADRIKAFLSSQHSHLMVSCTVTLLRDPRSAH